MWVEAGKEGRALLSRFFIIGSRNRPEFISQGRNKEAGGIG